MIKTKIKSQIVLSHRAEHLKAQTEESLQSAVQRLITQWSQQSSPKRNLATKATVAIETAWAKNKTTVLRMQAILSALVPRLYK